MKKSELHYIKFYWTWLHQISFYKLREESLYVEENKSVLYAKQTVNQNEADFSLSHLAMVKENMRFKMSSVWVIDGKPIKHGYLSSQIFLFQA